MSHIFRLAKYKNNNVSYVFVLGSNHSHYRNATDTLDVHSTGFEDSFTICCGYHGTGYDVYCGSRATVNGTEVYAGSCEDPSRVISWDGVHYTEAANSWLATRIMSGSYSDPPVEITKACRKQM